MRRPKRVLVVEGDPPVRELLVHALVAAGYDVLAAREGRRGLELAERDRPHLVLLDLALPSQSGLEMLRALQEREATRTIPVIVGSAFARLLAPHEAPSVAAVVEKPFELHDLLSRIDQAVSQARPADGEELASESPQRQRSRLTAAQRRGAAPRSRRALAAGPLALLAASLLLGAGLAWLLEARLTDLVLDQLAAQAADWVALGLRDQLAPADFEIPSSPGTVDDVGARLDPAFARLQQANASLLRLNLFARDGTVLYSDLAPLRSRSLPEEAPLLTRALSGAFLRQVSSLSDADDADLRPRHLQALEVYGPLVLGDRVAGAYEVYRDLALLHALRSVIWSALAAWATMMALLLLLVARSAAAHR